MHLMLVLGPFATIQAIATTLSLSGLLADHVFKYIGVHPNKLEMFSLTFAGDRNIGLHYVLSGLVWLIQLPLFSI
uniref:TIR1 n=1 Tax=Solanum tuberosum TaxID=4113 RepID=M1CNG0_SOLTU